MIGNRQIANEMEDIIKGILQNGSMPVYEDVMKELDKRFTKNPGNPTFTPIPIKPYSVSDPELINELFTSLLKDIIIASEENNAQSGKLLALLNYYELEKKKIMADLEDQNFRLDGIKEYKAYYINGSIIGTRFTSFTNIEMDGDIERNIPATTCLVDLRQQKAYNWRQRYKNDVTETSVSIKPISQVKNVEEIYPFNACLYDTLSEAWMTKVTSDISTASIEVIMTFPKPVEANSLIVTLLSSRATTMSLSLSEDGQTFIEKADTVISNKVAEWNFDTQKILAAKMTINKSEPNGLTGTEYDFYFGAENISLYKDTYKDEGVLVTKPMYIENASKLMLVTRQLVYPKSSIKYYIIFDGPEGVEWKEIDPAKDPNRDLYKIDTPVEGYTGNIRLVAVFHNYVHSPQLLNYKIVVEGAVSDGEED